MKTIEKILFVDADDTARGVMASQIMRREELISEPQIDSRGIVVLFPEPLNRKAEAVLARNNLSAAGHEARQLTQEDVTRNTLVLVMEERQKEKVREIAPEIQALYTVSEYAGIPGDIGELFGAELPAYGACYELLEKLITIIAAKINEEEDNR